MSRRNGINLKKLERITQLACRNGIRLHLDSITLFENQSYPSSFFLSVLALEEIGKALMLNNLLWHSTVEGRMGGEHEEETIGNIFYHQLKQKVFAWEALTVLPKALFESLYSEKMERAKQNSVYVGLPRKGRRKGRLIVDLKAKIIRPDKVGKKTAETQITALNDALLEFAIGVGYEFYGFDALDEMLNKNLVKTLSGRWKQMSGKAKLRIRQLHASAEKYDKRSAKTKK